MAIVAPARAQQGQATLTGKVVDAASKKGVQDAVVTVTSPALQGEQIVTTDASGTYRVPALPPGVYTLHLDKEGYKAYQRDQIQLRADTTIRLDADLLPEGLKAEEVVVVAHAPTVDVGSATTGASMNSDFTSRIPITNPGAHGGAQRSFESVAEATPGASADMYGTSISGTSSPENSYVIDGMRTNSAHTGTAATPLSIEFVKEVNVLSGGYMPEYGRATGGILNVVTKSGSNEYHGDVWANWTPGALEGKRKYPYFAGTAVQTQRSLGNVYDVGFDQSGPILKDKLWYFVGFGVSRAIYNLDRRIDQTTYNSDGTVASTSPVPGTGQQYQANFTSYQIFGRLDYRINQNNKLSLTLSGTPTTAGGNGDYSVNPQTGLVEGATTEYNLSGSYGALAHKYRSGAYNAVLKWTTEFDNKSKNIETTVGYQHELAGRLPSDGFNVGSGLGYAAQSQIQYRAAGSNGPVHGIGDFESVPAGYCGVDAATKKPLCPVVTYANGGPGQVDQQVLDVYNGRSVLTILANGLGHHVIKAGVDLDFETSWWSRGYTGTEFWRESAGGSSFSATRAYGFLSAPDQATLYDRFVTRAYSFTGGGFVQDSWSIMDKITLNAGVRWDNQFLFGQDGKLLVSLPNQVSPRVGLIFDPTQQGRSKLFFNYARFYESVPTDMVDRETGEGQTVLNISKSACQPYSNGVCNPSTLIKYPANGGTQGQNVPDRVYRPNGQGKSVIDPDLSPQSSSEIVAGGEYELFKNGRFGASYTRRWMNNIIDDMSNDEAATYFIGNPGKGIGSNFPKAERNYDAGTVYFTKTFADQWLLQVSYTLSWLRGNINGLFDPQTGQLDPNINATFDLRSLLANQNGDLFGDHRHSIKAYAAKDISVTKESDVSLGASFQARSGGPTNYLGSHAIYGPDNAYILPRGSGERLPWNANVGTHVGYEWHFESGMRIGITMDIFNLLNFQGALNTDQRYTNADVLPVAGGSTADLPTKTSPGRVLSTDTTPNSLLKASQVNPNFGNPNYYQEPRQFRFGIRGSF